MRSQLLKGGSVDLRVAPAEVEWIQLKPECADAQRISAARTKAPTKDGCVLVIADSDRPRGQQEVASRTPGALTVEAVDMRDLTNFGRSFAPTDRGALEQLATFASGLMTNVGPKELLKRVVSLQNGTARKEASPEEAAALHFCKVPTFSNAAGLLAKLRNAKDTRLYRSAIYHSCMQAFQEAARGTVSLHDATVRAREQYRHLGRDLPRRAVGSTLLLKGLEADVAVLLNPEPMDQRHLYVALTRGARKIVVCSESSLLRPSP